MKACVTGATGFIGSRLTLFLKDLGVDVVALGLTNNDAEKQRYQTLQNNGIQPHNINVIDKGPLVELLQGCDVVFHLAAAQHEANVPDQYFYDVNVIGTRNLLEASVKAGVRRFVYGSTIGVYGDALEGELNEFSQVNPTNVYGKSKLEAEFTALSFNGQTEVVVVRIAETYGPGDQRLLKLFKGIKKGLFLIIGSGTNIHQLIYIDDLIAGLHAASQCPTAPGEIYVLAGEEKLTTADMFEYIAQAENTNPRRLKAPILPFAFAARLLERICPPLGINPPLRQRRLDFFRKSFYFNNEKTALALNFKSQTLFCDGAKRTADWYIENRLL